MALRRGWTIVAFVLPQSIAHVGAFCPVHRRRGIPSTGATLTDPPPSSVASTGPTFVRQSPAARVWQCKASVDHDEIVSEEFHFVEEIWQSCVSVVAGTLTAGVLLFMNPSTSIDEQALSSRSIAPEQHQIRFFQPRAALAADGESDGSDTPPHALDDGLPHALDDSLPTPDAVGTMSSPTDVSALSPLRVKRNSVLDEVWSLVDKYYIDQTFNGQNWNDLRDKYEDQLDVDRYDDDAAMRLATDLVRSLGDKYSRVLDKSAYAAIQKFDLIGVGATLMPDGDKRLMVGAPPVPGSAAEQAGIKMGDFVTAVNGVPTEDRTAFDIIDQISEDPNARKVTMTVLTQGPDDIKGEGYVRDVALAREFAEVKDPISHKITERRPDGIVVGYIRMREFNSLVKPKLEEAIRDLEGQGANAFVLDARANPGGAFQSAVEIAGLFLDDRVATTVVDGNNVELPFRTSHGKVIVDPSSPMVFWVDGRSASATEVLAGALRDNCRALVMGEKSFGKGRIQAVYGLKNGSGLVLTVARYVTPAGTDIQGSGISPDISGVPSSLVPFVLSADTSKVDFSAVKEKLGPPMCEVPKS